MLTPVEGEHLLYFDPEKEEWLCELHAANRGITVGNEDKSKGQFWVVPRMVDCHECYRITVARLKP